MATTNISIKASDGWVRIVPSAATSCFVTCTTPFFLEVATSASDVTKPTVTGHAYNASLQISRLLFTTGAIWARMAPGNTYGTDTTALLVVDSA